MIHVRSDSGSSTSSANSRQLDAVSVCSTTSTAPTNCSVHTIQHERKMGPADSQQEFKVSLKGSSTSQYRTIGYHTQVPTFGYFEHVQPTRSEQVEFPSPSFLYEESWTQDVRGEGHSQVAHSRAASTSTISSTEEDFVEIQHYAVPADEPERYWSDALSSTPEEFSDLYPSPVRLDIQHDDSTSDGNMNLRIDTKIHLQDGKQQKLTLFHLRMHDLKTRQFSLRRYGRDSGREICHSLRCRRSRPASMPSLTRSLSSILAKSFLSRAELKANPSAELKRHDSGHDFVVSDNIDNDELPQRPLPSISELTDNIGFEFSNYSKLDLRWSGHGSRKRYDFEYWGIAYSWKRVSSTTPSPTHHLVRCNDNKVIAHIVPKQLTKLEAEEEESVGGWISPCTFWLRDVEVQADLGDVIMATALATVVDESIRRRFHSKEHRPMLNPKLNPKQWINDAFGR